MLPPQLQSFSLPMTPCMQQAALRDLIAEINLLSLMHKSAVLIIKAYYSLKQLEKKTHQKSRDLKHLYRF